MKLRAKLSEKLKEIYSQVDQEIRVLSREIWQRLNVHTAFFLSTAELRWSQNRVSMLDSCRSAKNNTIQTLYVQY